jgi:hypothetical protein
MKKGVLVGLLLVSVIAVGAMGVGWWITQPVEHPIPVDVAFDQLDEARGGVRLRGTAHYVARVNQHVEATLFSEAKTIYSYGLFPRGDISSKEIQVLIRTEHPVPKNIDFEYLEVEGYLEQPNRQTVPFQMERVLGGQTGYFFSPDLLVLRAWHQQPISVD